MTNDRIRVDQEKIEKLDMLASSAQLSLQTLDIKKTINILQMVRQRLDEILSSEDA